LEVRRDSDYFADTDPQLVYVAARLEEAQAIEALLTERSVDYLVEPDTYTGGIVFRTERVGAFFYVRDTAVEKAREALKNKGYRPYKP